VGASISVAAKRLSALIVTMLMAGPLVPSSLAAVPLPAAAGREFTTAAPVYRDDLAKQLLPAVTSNGSLFLAAWRDERHGYPGAVMAARVSSAGGILDRGGIMLDLNPEDTDPEVASDGVGFLVVWGSFTSEPGVFGALIDPSGRITKPQFPIYTAVNAGSGQLSVAYNGLSYLVVWDYLDPKSGATDIYAARVSPSGVVLDSPPVIVSAAVDNQFDPVVASSGDQFFVAWGDARNPTVDMYGARVAADGTVLDPVGIQLATQNDEYEQNPSIGSGGGLYFVAWDTYEDGFFQIEATRVNEAGQVLDPSGIDVSSTDSSNGPSVASDGTGFMVTWTELNESTSYDVLAARVASDGTIEFTESPVCQTVDGQSGAAITWGDGSFLAAWVDNRSGVTDEDIFGTRILPDGTVLDGDGFPFIRMANEQTDPAIASNGVIHLVVWEDDRSGSETDIYAARISARGRMLDGSGIPVSVAPGDQAAPVVASLGSDFLVAWNDRATGTIEAVIVSSDGLVGGVQTVSSHLTTDVEPSVTSDGVGLYLVVWLYAAVFAARVDAFGTVLDPGGFLVAVESLGDGQAAVASDGQMFLVAWPGNVPSVPYGSDIRAARVDGEGVVRDPSGIDVSLADSRQVSPSVAARSGVFLVTWEDYRDGSCIYDRCLYADVFANRIRRTGQVLDGAGFRLFDTPPVSEFRPTTVWGQDVFWVGWESYPDPVCHIEPFSCGDGDVRGARVSVAGEVIDPHPIDLARKSTGETIPDLALGPNGTVALSYQRRGEAGVFGGALRAYMRILSGF
jgi:hypothetical protein